MKPQMKSWLLMLPFAAFAAGTAEAEQFTLMVRETPSELALRSDPQRGPAYWASYASYSKAMQDAGVLRGGMALAADARVQHVAAQGSSTESAAVAAGVTSIGGYFVIEVADLAAAKLWAARAPSAGGVDIHPAYPAPAMR